MTCQDFTQQHTLKIDKYHTSTNKKLTWYGLPDFKILLALPSSFTFGSPGMKGSTFPVCECGLLKFDACTKNNEEEEEWRSLLTPIAIANNSTPIMFMMPVMIKRVQMTVLPIYHSKNLESERAMTMWIGQTLALCKHIKCSYHF